MVWRQHTLLLRTDDQLCLEKDSGEGSASSGTVMITPIVAVNTYVRSANIPQNYWLEEYRIASVSAESALLRFASLNLRLQISLGLSSSTLGGYTE